MPNKIYKITYSQTDLANLGKDDLSVFLLLGLFLNEVNWIRKILLISALDESGNEAEKNSRLALSLMLSKMLASKIHAGWCRMLANPVKTSLEAACSTVRVKELKVRLEPLVSKGSLIHSVRNEHASHYPLTLSLDGLPNIAHAELAIYASQNSGDKMFLLSELSAASELIALTHKQTVGEAVELLLSQVVNAAGIYAELLDELLSCLIGKTKVPVQSEVIEDGLPIALDDIKLRFFTNPPSVKK
jgi:hypothetical protein